MESIGGAAGSGIDGPTRAEAREILRDLLRWRLPPAAWQRPAASVEAMADALAAADAGQLAKATAGLEELSPHRVERIRDPDELPPPEKVRDRVVFLIQCLDDAAAGDEGAQHGGDERPPGGR